MITAVAFVCTVLVAGLTLWAWFKGTGQELQATVDRVLAPVAPEDFAEWEQEMTRR